MSAVSMGRTPLPTPAPGGRYAVTALCAYPRNQYLPLATELVTVTGYACLRVLKCPMGCWLQLVCDDLVLVLHRAAAATAVGAHACSPTGRRMSL